MWFPGFCLKGIPKWNHYGLWCDFMWHHSMTPWCQVRSWYDVITSRDVTWWICVHLSINNKKGTLGQKVCTILETREVRERSGVFIWHMNVKFFNSVEYFPKMPWPQAPMGTFHWKASSLAMPVMQVLSQRLWSTDQYKFSGRMFPLFP